MWTQQLLLLIHCNEKHKQTSCIYDSFRLRSCNECPCLGVLPPAGELAIWKGSLQKAEGKPDALGKETCRRAEAATDGGGDKRCLEVHPSQHRYHCHRQKTLLPTQRKENAKDEEALWENQPNKHKKTQTIQQKIPHKQINHSPQKPPKPTQAKGRRLRLKLVPLFIYAEYMQTPTPGRGSGLFACECY